MRLINSTVKLLIVTLFIFSMSANSIHANKVAEPREIYPSSTSKPSSFFPGFNQVVGSTNFTLSSTSGDIIFALLKYLMVFAGLILFLMVIAGGFQLMFGAGDPKQAEAGKARITQALIGFIIIFTAYWITQIIEVILGVNILK